jgi:hypothetical protein
MWNRRQRQLLEAALLLEPVLVLVLVLVLAPVPMPARALVVPVWTVVTTQVLLQLVQQVQVPRQLSMTQHWIEFMLL